MSISDKYHSGNVASMPQKLRDCVAVAMGTKIFVAGGFDKNGICSNKVYCYDPGAQYDFVWRNQTFLNGKIRTVLLSQSDEKLYFIINGTDVRTYDPVQNEWNQVFAENPISDHSIYTLYTHFRLDRLLKV